MIFLKCDYHVAARRSGEPDVERLFDIQCNYGFILRNGSKYHDADVHVIDTCDLSAYDVFARVYNIIEEAMKCEQ